MEFFDIRLIGINAENGQKIVVTIVLLVVLSAIRRLLAWIPVSILARWTNRHTSFLMRQAANLITGTLLVLGLLSIWFDDPTRLATAVGLVAAGLAFAMQRVVTSLAGYFVILRGNTFTVGDRITMGGVRGDVVRLGFIQTTIMEMGQPPAVQGADPAVWVQSRQYTGRLVTVSNDSIFQEPVFNYTRDFPYLWEEIRIPVTYTADRTRAEAILLDAARRHGAHGQEASHAALSQLGRRYFIDTPDLQPVVYYRITDNWLELTVRFLTNVRGVRDVKDTMSREILTQLDEARIGIASATYDIVGMPALRVQREQATS